MALAEAKAGKANAASSRVDELHLKIRVAEVLDRWPSAGVAVAVVRDGSPEWFFGHGVAALCRPSGPTRFDDLCG